MAGSACIVWFRQDLRLADNSVSHLPYRATADLVNLGICQETIHHL